MIAPDKASVVWPKRLCDGWGSRPRWVKYSVDPTTCDGVNNPVVVNGRAAKSTNPVAACGTPLAMELRISLKGFFLSIKVAMPVP